MGAGEEDMISGSSQHMNSAVLVAKAQGAFLGAAIGDALGWPQEDRSRRVYPQAGNRRAIPIDGFERWTRKSGGKYFPHEDLILAGEYSDDTQLLLCTARGLLHGRDWWQFLTGLELPFWSAYERGGGGSTKRAVAAWLAGRRPWSPAEASERYRYFEAGGNGAAMRIMPHSLLGVGQADFAVVAENIMANGICTHGHPRALIGALAFGFAVWEAFRATGTLEYGTIVEKLISSANSWSALPDVADVLPHVWPTWNRSADEARAGRYHEDWRTTAAEMLQLLETCRDGMKQGALSIDQEVLARMGCFDRKMRGAGTVTAAASIFLASRYASDPGHGLVEAAFAEGADTDTIASMTGCLLGAVLGPEWLSNKASQVQDSQYLRALGERLVVQSTTSDLGPATRVQRITERDVDAFVARVKGSKDGDAVSLPDGREARIAPPQEHRSLSKTTLAVSWKLTTSDGQTLYVKSMNRVKSGAGGDSGSLFVQRPTAQPVDTEPRGVVKLRVRLHVSDMARSRCFYEKALGMPLMRESGSLVNLGDAIALVPSDWKKGSTEGTGSLRPRVGMVISIETRSLDADYDNVRRFGATILKPITRVNGWRLFQCLDPDRNVVEVVETIGRAMHTKQASGDGDGNQEGANAT